MERRGILVLYPEARYANVGTSSALPKSVGKLAKYLDVPLVTLNRLQAFHIDAVYPQL